MFGHLTAGLQRLMRRYVFGMDIHPSVTIAPSAYIDRTWPKGIHIAEGCVVGEEAIVLTHDMTRGIYVDTYIGARTRIGPRAIIMPGLNIGADCVIRPGAMVTRDMPAGHVALGNPAEISPSAEAAQR